MTSPHEAEQSRTILKTVTAGEHVSNICVSTICNSVNMKPSIASSTFAVKPVTNSVKFKDIVNPLPAGDSFFVVSVEMAIL